MAGGSGGQGEEEVLGGRGGDVQGQAGGEQAEGGWRWDDCPLLKASFSRGVGGQDLESDLGLGGTTAMSSVDFCSLSVFPSTR